MSSPQKTSVAMLIDAWFPFYGGGQVHVNNLSQALRHRHNCHVKIFHPTHSSTLTRAIWSLLVIPQLLYSAKKNRIDLIHSHGYIAGLPAIITAKLFKVPVVHTVHGSSLLDQKTSGIKAWFEKILLTKINYHAQISVSNLFLRYHNVNSNIAVIPNAVNTKQFDDIKINKNKQPTVIWVGRSDPVKGFRYLKQALTQVKKTLPNLKTITVSDGKLSGKRLIRAYKKSHLFVLASLAEGQPITLLEAWAAKLPVVVTRVGENPTMVKHGTNGFLVEPKNSQQLAQAILKVLSNPTAAKKMGSAGYKLVKKDYTWKKVANQTYQIYRDLLESP